MTTSTSTGWRDNSCCVRLRVTLARRLLIATLTNRVGQRVRLSEAIRTQSELQVVDLESLFPRTNQFVPSGSMSSVSTVDRSTPTSVGCTGERVAQQSIPTSFLRFGCWRRWTVLGADGLRHVSASATSSTGAFVAAYRSTIRRCQTSGRLWQPS